MSPITKALVDELQRAPESVQQEVLDFLRFLEARRAAADADSLLPIAEGSWAADWDTPEEDAAWQDL